MTRWILKRITNWSVGWCSFSKEEWIKMHICRRLAINLSWRDQNHNILLTTKRQAIITVYIFRLCDLNFLEHTRLCVCVFLSRSVFVWQLCCWFINNTFDNLDLLKTNLFWSHFPISSNRNVSFNWWKLKINRQTRNAQPINKEWKRGGRSLWDSHPIKFVNSSTNNNKLWFVYQRATKCKEYRKSVSWCRVSLFINNRSDESDKSHFISSLVFYSKWKWTRERNPFLKIKLD